MASRQWDHPRRHLEGVVAHGARCVPPHGERRRSRGVASGAVSSASPSASPGSSHSFSTHRRLAQQALNQLQTSQPAPPTPAPQPVQQPPTILALPMIHVVYATGMCPDLGFQLGGAYGVQPVGAVGSAGRLSDAQRPHSEAPCPAHGKLRSGDVRKDRCSHDYLLCFSRPFSLRWKAPLATNLSLSGRLRHTAASC